MIFGIRTANKIAQECGCTIDEVKAEVRELWQAEEYDKRKFYGTLGIMILVSIVFALVYSMGMRYLGMPMVYFYFCITLIVYFFTKIAVYGATESRVKERLGKRREEARK